MICESELFHNGNIYKVRHGFEWFQNQNDLRMVISIECVMYSKEPSVSHTENRSNKTKIAWNQNQGWKNIITQPEESKEERWR